MKALAQSRAMMEGRMTKIETEAEIRDLTEVEIDAVAGGKIEQVNGGGNIPQGSANGVDFVNPAGSAPGGWN